MPAVCNIPHEVKTNDSILRAVSARNLIAAAIMFGGLIAIGYKWSQMLNLNALQIVESSYGKFYSVLIGLIPLPFVLLVSWKWPAVEFQGLFSTGLAQDFAYVLLRLLVRVSLIAVIWELVGVIHLVYFPGLIFTIPDSIPLIARFIAAFLIVDLLFYFDHRIRHKFSLFWHFHAVHHSQRELNFFTDSRSHIMDRVWSLLILAVPTLVLKLNAPQVILLSLLIEFHQAIYHVNVRSNYGFLRYILVTPQSHRIHHSVLPQHQNKNFGGSLSIWDHMFGTQYRNYDEYPETGIEDPYFPHEAGKTPIEIVDTFGAHFLYPFEALYRQFRG